MYGRDPLGARLDELVVVELLEVLVERCRARAQSRQQRAQRLAVLRVAHAVDRRQQPIERRRSSASCHLLEPIERSRARASAARRAARCRSSTRIRSASSRACRDGTRLRRRARPAVERIEIHGHDARHALRAPRSRRTATPAAPSVARVEGEPGRAAPPPPRRAAVSPRTAGSRLTLSPSRKVLRLCASRRTATCGSPLDVSAALQVDPDRAVAGIARRSARRP